MIKLNTKSPDFCLKNQDNKPICLKEYTSHWVVLYFYPKDNTPGCTLEAKRFTFFENEFKKHNTKVLGISPDSCESHKKFQENHKLTITLLSDPEHTVLKNYGVWKTKKMYGKEYLGVERTTLLINPQGNIKHIWNNVKVPGHIEAVLEKLKEIQTIKGDAS